MFHKRHKKYIPMRTRGFKWNRPPYAHARRRRRKKRLMTPDNYAVDLIYAAVLGLWPNDCLEVVCWIPLNNKGTIKEVWFPGITKVVPCHCLDGHVKESYKNVYNVGARPQVQLLLQSTGTSICRHIYNWNIVYCDVKQRIFLMSLTITR